MEEVSSRIIEKIRDQFLDEWEVPNFKINFSREKTSKYCVVIPVINEGDRIKLFLKRLKEINIASSADIIIIDGGSRDNSLNHASLKASGVYCLLTKVDKGKLSSQLRIAYSYALVKGYEGIITIDGNNKDEPSTIFKFINLLDKGYDFVQASRFLKGGKHINTPIIRYLAIRLIHAPLLSIFSGFYWTDTTQGFRAYSKTCLMHSRVKPFRDVFLDYELLSYLSYRIPRIGLKCIEYPSSRFYPRGKIPTKISNFSGNIKLIKTLLKTCCGSFNP
tara:strand:- start:338 stop:1165 length:828 start_codon:yes stop_codon:yes gene_type:complete